MIEGSHDRGITKKKNCKVDVSHGIGLYDRWIT